MLPKGDRFESLFIHNVDHRATSALLYPIIFTPDIINSSSFVAQLIIFLFQYFPIFIISFGLIMV